MEDLLTKEELERIKLQKEIQALERPWYQKPAYLATLIPITLAVLTFFGAILSGYFDGERLRLKNEVEAYNDSIQVAMNSLQHFRSHLAKSTSYSYARIKIDKMILTSQSIQNYLVDIPDTSSEEMVGVNFKRYIEDILQLDSVSTALIDTGLFDSLRSLISSYLPYMTDGKQSSEDWQLFYEVPRYLNQMKDELIKKEIEYHREVFANHFEYISLPADSLFGK